MSSCITSRRSFSVLLVAWFNLTMLPCAMAAGVGAGQAAGSSGHGQAVLSQHMHHAAADAPACATLQTECCELGKAVRGDTTPRFENKPVSSACLVTAPAYTELRPPAVPRTWRPSDPPDLGGGSPRLHVIHCVYLD